MALDPSLILVPICLASIGLLRPRGTLALASSHIGLPPLAICGHGAANSNGTPDGGGGKRGCGVARKGGASAKRAGGPGPPGGRELAAPCGFWGGPLCSALGKPEFT